MAWLYDFLRLKINNYIIIDDFFPEEICKELREKILNSKKYGKYWDYKSVDFNNAPDDESLEYISDKYIVPRISLAKKYVRAWSFVYDNVSRGVLPHADPSFINVNIWVTPDECIEDHNKNGLVIYKRQVSPGVRWEIYNKDNEWIKKFLKNSKYDIIPYKYNRAIIFRGSTFHATDNVHMKQGDQNKRVNYTFLYE